MKKHHLFLLMTGLFMVSCAEQSATSKVPETGVKNQNGTVTLQVSSEQDSEFDLNIPETGRYRITAYGNCKNKSVWLEDYIDNKDERTYNVTGFFSEGIESSIDGSPLQKGHHLMRLHISEGSRIDSLRFELKMPHLITPDTLKQNMEGESWQLAWSDEFDIDGLPDTSKWAYNWGNWGWGNNELQYYTVSNKNNAVVKNGSLFIRAAKDSKSGQWTSARLTTQGKVAFQHGRIEYRAKVPMGRGTWSAGWMLGDSYRDEVSWPYCGEIDIMECVGYEIDSTTLAGINHGTCHTPAYYFKKNNQISAVIDVDSISSAFHTYAVEWYPNKIMAFVDGVHYYTYDKTADDREWPFFQPQNIIVNLAIGGGWGGAKGLDPRLENQILELDYIRVYSKI